MIKRNKAKITGMIATAYLAGLCLTACDREEPLGGKPDEPGKPGSTELRFAAALAGNPSTKAIGKPVFLEGTTFPMNNAYIFGMFITDDAGNGLPAGTENNMKTTLTRGASAGNDIWAHATSAGAAISPKADPAQSINIYGYYPWITGATATSVPFDLTGGMEGKQELLYLSSTLPASPITMPDDGQVALTFSHAYCWVKVKLTKLSDLNVVKVKSVSIDNLHTNLSWIKNQGTINPRTGDVNGGATAGPLEANCASAVDVPLDGSSTAMPLEFDFLIPSFMSADVKDGEVVIHITTEDEKVLTFPLTRNNLNGSDGVGDIRGFRKGWKNEYNVVYNNAAMILQLSDWQSYPVNGTLGGQVGGTSLSANYKKGQYFDYSYGIRPFGVSEGQFSSEGNADNHLFHTYLGEVANGNNGSFVTATIDLSNGTIKDEWSKTGSQERVNPKLTVAGAWGAGGSPVPWKDPATGVLAARQACASLREGGYKDWRLPRINEFFIVYQRLRDESVNKPLDTTREYWSGTESDANNAWVITKGINGAAGLMLPYPRGKTTPLYVRCVRDATKPK